MITAQNTRGLEIKLLKNKGLRINFTGKNGFFNVLSSLFLRFTNKEREKK